MSTRLRRITVALLVTAALVVVPAAPAAAHARLVSSEPAGGATVEQSPEQIVIEFSETIESSFGGIQVFGPDGARVDTGLPEVAGSRLVLAIPPLAAAGNHTVAFRVISADGHPIEASYTFVFAPPPATTTTPSTASDERPAARSDEEQEEDEDDDEETTLMAGAAERPADPIVLEGAGTVTRVGLWLARLFNYSALTALIGFLVVAFVLLAPERGATRRRRALRGAAVAAAAVVASGVAVFGFGLSNAAARPLPDVVDGELLGLFASTRFGTVVLLQALLAVVAFAALTIGRGRRVAPVALGAAGLSAAAPALWGHAGTDELAVLAVANDWLHLLAVTAWVGGLAALTWLFLRTPSPASTPAPVPRPAVLAFAGPAGEQGQISEIEHDVSDDAHPADAGPALAKVVTRFSRLAGWALLVVAVTGVINAALHLGGLGALVDTGWGRLVLVKAGLFACLALVGLSQRRRVLPRLAQGGAPAQRLFRQVVSIELMIMLLAFGAATQMASGIPADAERASRIQSFVTPFGADGQLNVTVDPGRVGTNVVHLYLLQSSGQLDPGADEATLQLERDGVVRDVNLIRTGPGHYSAFGAELPTSGEWLVRVGATVDGDLQEATGRIVVR